jgi:hypothetical protein
MSDETKRKPVSGEAMNCPVCSELVRQLSVKNVDGRPVAVLSPCGHSGSIVGTGDTAPVPRIAQISGRAYPVGARGERMRAMAAELAANAVVDQSLQPAHRPSSRFSPGPWHWTDDDRDGIHPLLRDADGNVIASGCETEIGGCDFDVPRAGIDAGDARLIAAAPEMLALLRRYAVAWDEELQAECEALLKRIDGVKP